jgi:glycosyltransferase involved in cell wall biosynthesis
VAVFPYRAEGFCLPILEAMACGTPPIVPDFGACLDFCSTDVAFLTPVRRIQLPVNARFKVALGFEEEVKEVDFCEMERAALAQRMREVASGAVAERRRMGEAGVVLAGGQFTWEASVARAVECLDELGVAQGDARIVR